MALPAAGRIRRIILIINGLTFLLVALGDLFFPVPAAYIYGFTLNGLDGLNEFRAVFIGFWIGLTVLFFVAARRLELSIIGDLALLLVLLQALGRLLSFIIDGIPHMRFILVFFLELSLSLLGLLLRPRTSA